MKFLLLAFFLSVHYTSCVKYNELCYLAQKQCRGYYDFIKGYKVQCQKFKCESEYFHSCGTDFCAKSESSCIEFLKMKYFYQSMGHDVTFASQSIRNCPTKRVEFNSSDVCTNGENCQLVQVFALRYGVWRVAKPMDCLCNGSYMYACGTEYCAKDKLSCDALNTIMKPVVKKDSIGLIKPCGNDNLVSYHYS